MASVTGFMAALFTLAAGFVFAAPQRPLQPPQPLSPPASTLPLQLLAVMLDRETPARSSCFVRCTYPVERQGRFLVGQTACEFAEIREIRESGVIVNNLLRNRLEILTLAHLERPAGEATAGPPGETPTTASPPPPVIKETPDGVSVELGEGAVEHYLANLPQVLSSALATPRFRDGSAGGRSVDGYEIGGIKDAGVARQLGLANGDVLLAVNGQPLDGLPTVLRLLAEVQTTPRVTVTVLRNGQRVTLVFRTR